MFSLKLVTEEKTAHGYGYGVQGAQVTVVWAELWALGFLIWMTPSIRFIGKPV